MKALSELMSHSDMDGIHIGQVYPQPINGLQAFEIGNRLRLELDKPFTLYYDTVRGYSNLSPALPLQESDFPCLILYQKGTDPRLFRIRDLFTDNHSTTEFSSSFLDVWQSFINTK